MKTILRYIISIVFTVSGFVKAVDAVGFSFKLEEYFSPAVFNISFLEPLSLPIAIFVSALEIILGVMLLLKIRLKFTLLALIFLCTFFGFLTFYSAYFNVVTDCGCFGDALKMTPWQSFWKDIVLLIGLLTLWIGYRNNPNFKLNKFQAISLMMAAIISTSIIVWGVKSEPMIDFRDYKIGTDLKLEKQKLAQNPSEYQTVYILKNKQTGEEKKVNQNEFIKDKTFWEEGTPWEIQKDKTTSEITKQGYASEILKFKIEDINGKDITEEILAQPLAVLLFSYKPNELSAEEIKKAENIIKGKPYVWGISTKRNVFPSLPQATMDATAMKTIARSNPFILVLVNGKISKKGGVEDFID